MILPGKIEIGMKIPLTMTFTDDTDGSPIDPSSVTLRLRTPGGIETSYTYGIGSDIIKDSTGVYYYNLEPTEAGRWFYHWSSEGAAKTARAGDFIVQHSPFFGRELYDY